MVLDHQQCVDVLPKHPINISNIMYKTIAIQRVHVRGEYLELSTEIPDNVQDLVGNAEYLTNMGPGLHGLLDSIWRVL